MILVKTNNYCENIEESADSQYRPNQSFGIFSESADS